MKHRTWLAAIAAASLLMTGCAVTDPAPPVSADQESSHLMPDGTAMPGSEHDGHGAAQNPNGPSEAAQMICDGQVVTAVGRILGLESEVVPSSSWEQPFFTCTYSIDGDPLVLSVHDATDEAEGLEHFAAAQMSVDGAEKIEGMAGLGMPSFSDGEGIVAFVREGKTLLVDATALPSELGATGTSTRHDAAYALASAVLVCWVEHDVAP